MIHPIAVRNFIQSVLFGLRPHYVVSDGEDSPTTQRYLQRVANAQARAATSAVVNPLPPLQEESHAKKRFDESDASSSVSSNLSKDLLEETQRDDEVPSTPGQDDDVPATQLPPPLNNRDVNSANNAVSAAAMGVSAATMGGIIQPQSLPIMPVTAFAPENKCQSRYCLKPGDGEALLECGFDGCEKTIHMRCYHKIDSRSQKKFRAAVPGKAFCQLAHHDKYVSSQTVSTYSWTNDGLQGKSDPKHSEFYLIEWLMKPGNYVKYRNPPGKHTKQSMAAMIAEKIHSNGTKNKKTHVQVKTKIESIEEKMKYCSGMLDGSNTGEGINDNDLSAGVTTMEEKVNNYFRYYYDLVEVFGDQSSFQPKLTSNHLFEKTDESDDDMFDNNNRDSDSDDEDDDGAHLVEEFEMFLNPTEKRELRELKKSLSEGNSDNENNDGSDDDNSSDSNNN